MRKASIHYENSKYNKIRLIDFLLYDIESVWAISHKGLHCIYKKSQIILEEHKILFC